MQAIYAQRVQRLMSLAKQAGLGGVLIMPGPNLKYLTGLSVHLSERSILLGFPVDGEPFAFCPAFEEIKIREQTGITRIYPWGEVEGPQGALNQAIRAANMPMPIGVEYRYMRVLEREMLAAAVNDHLVYADAGALIAQLRSSKDPGELALMQTAAGVCDLGMAVAARTIRPGVTEAEVEASIRAELGRLGHRGECEIMVASGPRSAIPHAGTTERIMQDGELCWVDMVYLHQGYVGDITRTFPVGQASPELAKIFRICLEAQAAARAGAKAGLSGAQVDALARDYITAHGHGPHFTHRTGHGLGLEVHEEPYMVGSNHQPLVEGNTFTIEPGIYVPGLGGVRIEDDMVITASGAQALTTAGRDTLKP